MGMNFSWLILIPLILVHLIFWAVKMALLYGLNMARDITPPSSDNAQEKFKDKKDRVSGFVLNFIDIMGGILFFFVPCIGLSTSLINRSMRIMDKKASRAIRIASITQLVVVLCLPLFLSLKKILLLNFYTEGSDSTFLYYEMIGTALTFLVLVSVNILQVWAITMIPTTIKEARLLRSLLIGSSISGLLACWWWIIHLQLGALIILLPMDAYIFGHEHVVSDNFFEEWKFFINRNRVGL